MSECNGVTVLTFPHFRNFSFSYFHILTLHSTHVTRLREKFFKIFFSPLFRRAAKKSISPNKYGLSTH